MNERIKEIIAVPFSSQLCINCKKVSLGGSSYILKYFKGSVSLRRVVHDSFSWFSSAQGDAYWYIYYERGTTPDRSIWGMRRGELD